MAVPREEPPGNDLESTPALEQARARVGDVLKGKWKLDRVIGIGGMGAVYAATHRNGRRCAIKVLLPLHGADRKTVQRFLKEGYVANEIGHPDTVEIHDDDFTDDGLPFLVMELLDGESLTERLEAPPHRLDEREAVRIAVDLLDVLEAAHLRGIVHRDVKPDNVFVLTTGKVKLLDFGIARLRTMTAAGATTASGALLGTPSFMAPEQARGRIDEIDARSDVFGVGATLFAALSGQAVRDADTVNEILLHAMTQPARPLAEVAPEISSGLAAIVDRALAFSREGRWASAAAMRDTLMDLARGGALAVARTTNDGAYPRARVTPASERARARSSLDATVAASEPSAAPPPSAGPSEVRGKAPSRTRSASRRLLLLGAAATLAAALVVILAASRARRDAAVGASALATSDSAAAVVVFATARPVPMAATSDPSSTGAAATVAPTSPSSAATTRAPLLGLRPMPKASPSVAPAAAAAPAAPSAPPAASADPFRRRL